MWWPWSYEQNNLAQNEIEAADPTKETSNNISNMAEELANSNEFVTYLNNKIKRKEEIKKAFWDDDWTNDWSDWKRLWIFILNVQPLPEELVQTIRRNNIDIYWDEVWELHIPFQDLSIWEISESMKRLRNYLRANRDKVKLPKYLYWITYLADISSRYWFTVIALPNSIKSKSWASRLLETYKKDSSNPKRQKIARRFQQEDIKLCYISVDNLLMSENEITIRWFEKQIKNILGIAWPESQI